VRKNAGRLGIDPDRIAAGGGSAGGHLAAAAGTLPEFDEPGENRSISSKPNALVLFSPALDLTFDAWSKEFQQNRYPAFQARWGVAPESLSPTRHVRAGTPPTIILHGTGDTTVPFAQAEAFTAAMKKSGNRCELVGFEGQQHGFFNYGRDDEHKYFVETLDRADRFLTSLGYLKGEPTIREFVKRQ
jgi:acetyl esterase/lipase